MSWCAFSVDMDSVEDYARTYPIPGDAALFDDVYEQSAGTLRAFLANHGVAATLFVVTKDLDRPARAAALAELHLGGHELGLHSHSHRPALGDCELEHEFDESVARLRGLTGEAPRGYRAPSYVVHDFLHAKMVEHGLAYSSSVMGTPLILVFKLLFNLRTVGNRTVAVRERLWNWGRVNALLSPKDVYAPRAQAYWRAGHDAPFVEIPLTCVPMCGIPFQFTYLAPFGDGVVQGLAGWLEGREVNTSFHLLDFVNDSLARRLGYFNPNLRLPLEERLRKATLVVAEAQRGRRRRQLHEVASDARRRINHT